ncbi:MAG TPA: hypothetical protein DD417_17585 [Elusimicrobia bacterium]|nr:hypothetical protein [Elusimicrobiota bacterium]
MAMDDKKVTIQFSLSIGRSQVWCAVVLGLLCIHPTDLATENLTLTTYYPSPYGVYKTLRSTEDSYFATGGNNRSGMAVGLTTIPGIGTTNILRLAVNGRSNLSGGTVGIGVGIGNTDILLSQLAVQGGVSIGDSVFARAAAPAEGLQVKGRVSMGYNAPTASMTPPGASMPVQLDVAGSVHVSKFIYLESDCVERNSSQAAPQCAANEYATWVPGVYQDGNMYNYLSDYKYGDVGNGGYGEVTIKPTNYSRFVCCAK